MAVKLNIHDGKGANAGQYTVDDGCLEAEKGKQAVHDAVVAYMAQTRSGSANTKTRAEVSGGGAKPYRQKGTGRARAGSNRSPIWEGGGVTFGPKPRSFAKKINKKVRKLALRRAFTERLNEGAVTVLEKLDLTAPKTREVQNVLKSLSIDGSILLVLKEFDDKNILATRNLGEVLTIKSSALNAYHLLRFKNLVFTRDALDEFTGSLKKEIVK